MEPRLLTIGNFALADVYHDGNLILENSPGGINFRVALTNAVLANPTRFIAALPINSIWKKYLQLLAKYDVKPHNIINLEQPIKFIWHYQNQILKDIENLNLDQMKFVAKTKLDNIDQYSYVNLCALGLKNEKKILRQLKPTKQKISYIFHRSNLDAASVNSYLQFLSNIDFLFLNRQEASILADKSDIIRVGYRLSCLARNCFITEGNRGVHVFSQGHHLFSCPAPKVKRVDSSGAGDTFAGAVIASIVKGEDIETACRLGTTLAALSVADNLSLNVMKLLL